MPSVSTALWTLELFLRFPPSYPACSPLSDVDRSVRLSMIAALGSALRPAANCNTARRSSTSASKQPAASH